MSYLKQLPMIALMLIVGPIAVAESGFMDDYSILETREGDVLDRVYIAPGTMEALAAYNSVMIDQPEVFLADDTKYKGAKPDHLKALSDTLRMALVERFQAGGYEVVDEVGPGVVYMRWAVTDLYLKKKKKNFLAYTPIGIVVHSTAQLAVRDLWKKIDIVELSLEVEFLDAQTGELMAAVMTDRGQRKDKDKEQKQELVSWEELDATMRTFGERLRCQLDNSKKPESERESCAAIVIEPETA